LLSGVLLLLAFIGLLVVLLAGVVVRVVVGQTHIVIIVVGGGLVTGLLHFSRIVFMSKLGFLLTISCIGILGLLSHELESLWLAIALGDLSLR
jgi:hypothetical protein